MDIDAIEPPDPNPSDSEPIVYTINYSTIYHPYNPDQPNLNQPNLNQPDLNLLL